MVLWMGGWVWGLVVASRWLARDLRETGAWTGGPVNWGALLAAAFAVFWLVFWIGAGTLMVTAVISVLAGREVLEFDAGGLTRRWEPLAFPRARRYLVEHIRGLRAVQGVGRSQQCAWGLPAWLGGTGAVAFDYGPRTMHLAADAGEREGRKIVEAVLPPFPEFAVEGQ